MKALLKNSLLAAALSLGLSFAGTALAQETCDPKTEECPPPPCDPTKEECPEPPKGICHNIGGPQELGANCDGATGACTFTLEDGTTTTVALNHFLGIIIGAGGGNSLAAHIAHGDGFIIQTFDPPLHLASTGQNHQASNVECLAERVIPQPDEPGN